MSIEKIVRLDDGQWRPYMAGKWFGVETLCGHLVKGEMVERRWNPDKGFTRGDDQYGPGIPCGEWEYRLPPGRMTARDGGGDGT